MKFLGKCLPYVKRYSQEPQWNAFLFMAQILLFWECFFWRIQKSQFDIDTFSKKIAFEVLAVCLPYVKRYFQEYQLSAFLFIAQIPQILLFLGMLISQKSKIAVGAQLIFKNFIKKV